MPAYPLNPGNRFQLDVDGTVANYRVNGTGTATDITNAQLASLLGMGAVSTFQPSIPNSQYLDFNFIFPELRNMQGIRWSGATTRGANYGVQTFWSADTTNGIDGTWVQIAGQGGGVLTLDGSQYTSRGPNITAFVQSGVKAIRCRVIEQYGSTGLSAICRDVHFYGARAESGDHLHFWDPTSNAALSGTAFDFGDLTRGTTTTGKQFRIKNLSTTLTASGITLAYSNLAGVPLQNGQVSTDGTTWAGSLNIGSLAPGAISSVYYVRIISDVTATPLARAGRVTAVPTSWA